MSVGYVVEETPTPKQNRLGKQRIKYTEKKKKKKTKKDKKRGLRRNVPRQKWKKSSAGTNERNERNERKDTTRTGQKRQHPDNDTHCWYRTVRKGKTKRDNRKRHRRSHFIISTHPQLYFAVAVNVPRTRKHYNSSTGVQCVIALLHCTVVKVGTSSSRSTKKKKRNQNRKKEGRNMGSSLRSRVGDRTQAADRDTHG